MTAANTKLSRTPAGGPGLRGRLSDLSSMSSP